MEELLQVLLQFLFEVFGDFIVRWFFEGLEWYLSIPELQPLNFSLLGGGVGWLSLLLLPHAFIAWHFLRWAALAVFPAMGGAVGYAIPTATRKSWHIANGACLALAFCLVRFLQLKPSVC